MIGQNKKRLEITLAEDEYELLKSLSSRFNISKSDVIKQALKVFASKRKHGWTTWIQESTKKQETSKKEDWEQEVEKKTWNELIEDINQ